LGQKLKKIYGRTAFIEKNHFIISNVTRCIKSFKFFLLGILSNKTSVKILSNFLEEEEKVESLENQHILHHINAILQALYQKKVNNKKTNLNISSIAIQCSDQVIKHHCQEIGLDIDSFSIEFPVKKANQIFHPIKRFE
jgi:hypothetical protein